MEARVTIESGRPGVIESTRSESDSAQLIWMGSEAARGLSSDGLVQELYRTRRLLGDHRLVFAADSGVNAIELQTEIPIMRLHCPKHVGCTAREQFSSSDGGSPRFTIAFPGASYSNGRSVVVKVDQEWSTKDGECLEVVCPAVVRFRFGRFLFDEQVVALGVKLDLQDFNREALLQRVVSEENDDCLKLPGAADKFRAAGGSIAIANGSSELSIELQNSISGKVAVGTSFLGDSFKFELGYDRQTTSSTIRKFQFSEGAQYTAFVSVDTHSTNTASEILWHTTALSRA